MKFLITITLFAIAANIIAAAEEISPMVESFDDEAARQKKSYGASHGGYGGHGGYGQSHGYGGHGGYGQSHGGYGGHESYGHGGYGHGHGGHGGYGHGGHGGYGHGGHGGYGHMDYGYSLGAPNPMYGAKEKEPSEKPEPAASELDIVAAAPEDSARFERSTYGGSHGYSAPAPALHPGPATTHSYQSYAPTVPCAKNLLLSCAPSVAPVPCAAPSYGHSSYGHGHVGASKAY